MSLLARIHSRLGRRSLLAAAAMAGLAASGQTLFAQGRPSEAGHPRGHYPLIHQNMPVGDAARFNTFRDPSGLQYFQPVRISLPTTGEVELLRDPRAAAAPERAPAQLGLMVGHTYRFKVSEMPEFPGVELYPSVEVLDRLHPPRGREHNFPVPFEITAEEIDLVLEGRMVTKVIYLEQPQVAAPGVQNKPLDVAVLPGSTNLLTEADRTGRPLLLIRIGGRLPDPNGGDLGFYGTGAPAVASVPVEKPAKPAAPPEGAGADTRGTSSLRQSSAAAKSKPGTTRVGGWVSSSVTMPMR